MDGLTQIKLINVGSILLNLIPDVIEIVLLGMIYKLIKNR